MGTENLRRIRLLAWGLVVIVLAATAWFAVIAPRFGAEVQNTLGQGDYTLETTSGPPFTAARLRGAPSAIFFGYAHCPDVCPTTLGDIAGWQQALGPAGAALQVFFVTVDPERDDLAMMREYLSWSDGVTGVTGSRAEVDKVLKAFRIYARKSGEGPDYTMDHTAYVMLLDREGHFVQTVAYQEPAETVLPKLRALLGS